jgi:hypothetical protein
MPILDDIIHKIEKGINQFIAVCINANRDLPFNDYNTADLTVSGSYVVGQNNIKDVGDQKKFFVSKSTLLYSTVDTSVRFNSQNNVLNVILANTYYEFKHNIHAVFYYDDGDQEDVLKMWFEGVMYNEARRPQ